MKCFCADIAQPDEENISDVVAKMAPCKVETTIVDLKKEIAEAAFEAVACQATYDGGYWQSSPQTTLCKRVTTQGAILDPLVCKKCNFQPTRLQNILKMY